MTRERQWDGLRRLARDLPSVRAIYVYSFQAVVVVDDETDDATVRPVQYEVAKLRGDDLLVELRITAIETQPEGFSRLYDRGLRGR